MLEGPDGAGKTTLAGAIKGLYDPSRVVHLTYRFKDKMDLYHLAAMELALLYARESLVILDRWWPSEIVYANAYRGGTKWPLMRRYMERVSLRHGVTHVMCLPQDRSNYLMEFERLKGSREEMYNSGMDRVYDQYDTLAGSLGLYDKHPFAMNGEWLHYDRTLCDDPEGLNAYAEMVIDQASEASFSLPGFLAEGAKRDFSGNFILPRVMIVSRVGIRKTRRHLWPFVEDSETNRWLTKCLIHHSLPERAIGFVNAAITPAAMYKAYVQSQPGLIVTLGHMGSKLVRAAGLEADLELPLPHFNWDKDHLPIYDRLGAQYKSLTSGEPAYA